MIFLLAWRERHFQAQTLGYLYFQMFALLSFSFPMPTQFSAGTSLLQGGCRGTVDICHP